jgi:hypothetical protein
MQWRLASQPAISWHQPAAQPRGVKAGVMANALSNLFGVMA